MGNRLKTTLMAILVGVIGGPLLAGFSGFLTLSLIWIGLWLAQGVDHNLIEIFVLAGIFALLIAPFGGSVGAVVGLIVGVFSHRFGSLLNAGSFGGMIGSIIGLFTASALFGAEGDLISVAATLVALTISGIGTAIIIKQIQWRWRDAAPVK
jgi:hypothetical protein